MPMELLNTCQFLELLGTYLCVIVALPALIFYRKVNHFPAAVRFLTYFTIGNFYIINLVQALELVKCVVGFIMVKKGVWIRNIVADKEEAAC